MTIEQIRAKLPIQVEITQEMIDEGKKKLLDSSACIGYQVLKSVFGDQNNIGNENYMLGHPFQRMSWGVYTGGFKFNRSEERKMISLEIGTMEGVDMMELRTPMTVTLCEVILREYNY